MKSGRRVGDYLFGVEMWRRGRTFLEGGRMDRVVVVARESGDFPVVDGCLIDS